MIGRKWVYGMMLASMFLSACQPVEKTSKNADEASAQTDQKREVTFPFPQIPALLTDSEQRKEYLLKHYWDNFDFSDTLLVNNRSVSEQGWVNQLGLLASGPVPEAWIEESLDNLCTGMEKTEQARRFFMSMIDEYLYNPNSPYYDEDWYRIYLKRMLRSTVLDEASKSSLKFRLDLISRNMPGTLAQDFVYYLPDGTQHTLRKTPVEGNRLLLVFYDPECGNCQESLHVMAADDKLADAVAAGRLTVLAIYTEGNEAVWRKALPEIPQSWIVGNDRQQVKDEAKFDLKAMPSFYLLDGKKKILLKDASYPQVCARLGL